MTLLDRYLLRLLLMIFGFFALVLVSVYWVNQAVLLFEQLIKDGQSAVLVLELTILSLPLVISVVLPVAGFAAAAYSANRLAGESELLAIQATGLSPWRMMRPVLVFGLIVGLAVAVLVNALAPMARARLIERQGEMAQNVTAQFLRAGQFQFPVKGITLFIGKISAQGELLDLLIDDARNPRRQTTYTAQKALLVKTDSGPKLMLFQGMMQSLEQHDQTAPHLAVTRFEDMTFDLGGVLEPKATRKPELAEMTTLALLRTNDATLADMGQTRAKANRTIHDRISQPLIAPVIAGLGFAMLLLGGHSRFGAWPKVGAGIVGLIILQILINTVEARSLSDPALWPLLYLPPVAGAGMVAVVVWIASRPRRRRSARKNIPAGGAA